MAALNRALVLIAVIVSTFSNCPAADEPLDARKVRQLHQKFQRGEKLTPEEQAYYERGKAVRKKGKLSEKATVASGEVRPKSSTGLVPLCDMTAQQKYHGEEGGLYGGGSNRPPAEHRKAAKQAAAKIQPLDDMGRPSPDGKIVMVTHGMSNTTNESQRFISLANVDPRKNPAVVLVDGAQGGIDSRQWVTRKPTRNGADPWGRLEQRIRSAGATPQQVQVVWMKHAIARVGQFGEFPMHARQLQSDLAEISRMLKQTFPNLQLVYVSSRTYGGYATTILNPEPYAYESAFAVRWLIQDQIKGDESLGLVQRKAPVLLWGPYLWSDGEKGRKADGLAYTREDYREDGTHPSESGRHKIATQLLDFFTTDPTAQPWFRRN